MSARKKTAKPDQRRALPSVDKLLRAKPVAAMAAGTPRALIVRAVRAAVAEAREKPEAAPGDDEAWARAIATHLTTAATPTLRRVVNATGVVLHTNFGRAPLAPMALDAIARTASGYATLEYDVEKGARGSRHVHCAELLVELTGAKDAIVVNNAASALLLALAAAAEGGRVIVSRGELIEIGGGFRIPEIMGKAGVQLVEVGTTNRTRAADYAAALRDSGTGGRRDGKSPGRTVPLSPRPPVPRALLKVHRSNFKLEGFTAETSATELAALAKKARVPLLYDLGGGLLTDLSDVGLSGEPTLREAARSGASAVIASGDKLLGGPQAGLLLGSAAFIAQCRAHPLARAVRADKLTLAALAATLECYRDPATVRQAVPILRMLTAGLDLLEERAQALRAALPPAARAAVVATRATVGGGAFPGVELESRGVALAPEGLSAKVLAERLRGGAVPVIGTIQDGRVTLDVRTLLGDDSTIARAVTDALPA